MPNELPFDDKIISYRQRRRSSTMSMTFTVRFALEYTMLFFSEDARLRAAAPGLTQSLAETLASA